MLKSASTYCWSRCSQNVDVNGPHHGPYQLMASSSLHCSTALNEEDTMSSKHLWWGPFTSTFCEHWLEPSIDKQRILSCAPNISRAGALSPIYWDQIEAITSRTLEKWKSIVSAESSHFKIKIPNFQQ